MAVATAPTEWAPGTASDRIAGELDQFAMAAGEGPVVDALLEHAPVVVRDLLAPSIRARWPAWSTAAGERGICAVTAVPIEAGAIAAGVLSLYSTSAWTPNVEQNATMRRFADTALLVLLNLGTALLGTADRPDGAEPAELGTLLRSDVHQAAGMIMAQARIPIDQALARLRARAFADGRPLVEVAADVLKRRVRFDPEGDL